MVAVVGMMNPLIISPGLIFDGRSIIISVAGFIGGWVTSPIPPPGIVELRCSYEKNKREVMGSITGIRIDRINVPLTYRKVFDSILAHDKYKKDEQTGFRNKFNTHARRKKSPRYKVELAYGSRFEPWIQRVEELAK